MRKYCLVPLPDGPFAGLDLMSRAVFGLIWDRYRLSGYNVTGQGDASPWYDWDADAVYCVYDQRDLAAAIGCTDRTVRRCLDDLRRAGCLWWRRATYMGASRYYVPSPIYQYLTARDGTQ